MDGKLIAVVLGDGKDDSRRHRAWVLARFATLVQPGAALVQEGNVLLLKMNGEEGSQADVRDKVWRFESGRSAVSEGAKVASADRMAALYESSGCKGMGWRAIERELHDNRMDVQVFDLEDLTEAL